MEEQVAQRSCGASIRRITQNASAHGPEQPAVGGAPLPQSFCDPLAKTELVSSVQK